MTTQNPSGPIARRALLVMEPIRIAEPIAFDRHFREHGRFTILVQRNAVIGIPTRPRGGDALLRRIRGR